MKSRWSELKNEAVRMRRLGVSMTVIERQLGIPRSTLSGWFKKVTLSKPQIEALRKNTRDGWEAGRPKAVLWHHIQKANRLMYAKLEAIETLRHIDLSPETLDLAFAMLYWGEGAKSGSTSIASSDPYILRFVLSILRKNYDVPTGKIRCDLHLRMDQSSSELIEYWSSELRLPVTCFKYSAFDQRSLGKPTYDKYKGVCVIRCGRIDIQRKLMYLYTLFCEKVAALDRGA